MKSIVFKQPGGEPVVLFCAKLDLAMLQALVGGSIERGPEYGGIDHLAGLNIDLWMNENGKLSGQTPNLKLCSEGVIHDIICGSVLFTSHNGNGVMGGLNKEQIALVLEVVEGMSLK